MYIRLVYGPPGTGKTTFIMNELASSSTPLNKIALVSFTRKAAEVLKERIPKDGLQPRAGTIHSMCFKALQYTKTGVMDREKWMDFSDKSSFKVGRMGGTMAEGASKSDWDYVNLHSLYRANKRAFEQFAGLISHSKFVLFAQEYLKYKRTFGYVDYDDMLTGYVQTKWYEEGFEEAYIDEAQDLSALQWKVVLQAFRKCKRITVVGDVRQAIFGWTGASPEIFLRLRGEIQVLEQSYRVPESIVQFAKQHIVKQMDINVEDSYKGVNKEGIIQYHQYITSVKIMEDADVYILVRSRSQVERMNLEWYLKGLGLRYSIFGQDPIRYKTKLDVQAGCKVDDEYIALMYEKQLLFQRPRIHISTIHGVKGGEADQVVLFTDVTTRVHGTWVYDIESEHKVFYVAVTRTKYRLDIVLPQTYYYYKGLI